MATGRREIAKLFPDPSLLVLEKEEAEFFRALTGIKNDGELKEHISNVSAKAYETFPYPCIRGFRFTKLKILRQPSYKRALKLVQEHRGAILLDAACCFGNDLRKAVLDGWPVENAIAFDLESAFWECGHELFRSTPQSFPAGFVPGSAFDPSIIQPREPFYEPPTTPRPQDLPSLNSLTPLQGHISAIHASSFFHLFNEAEQLTLAKQLASLLSPEPGSMIFGSHRGTPVKTTTNDLMGYFMVCHSPESWREIWDGQVFRKGTVRVDAELEETKLEKDIMPESGKFWYLVWSVTRIACSPLTRM
ncbi:hypothetical protein P691DRAFT_708866 [Macrolepiota fuliginosa MF-IS2]|uniref:Methyltransferase ausD n=1 Tax=Macrolepiota fuliginosa MF-IS2 TaxID=1400762 RepID=A0A9P5X7J3_9AGAR|nr:hypothetical protein P691DRAFT_708866 [Macrolepiota fuliginosa MF-IS2]